MKIKYVIEIRQKSSFITILLHRLSFLHPSQHWYFKLSLGISLKRKSTVTYMHGKIYIFPADSDRSTEQAVSRRSCEVGGRVRWQNVWRLNFATDIADRCRALYDVRWYVSRFTLQNILLFFRFRFAVAPFELARDLRRFLIMAYSIRSLREASVSRVFFFPFISSVESHPSPIASPTFCIRILSSSNSKCCHSCSRFSRNDVAYIPHRRTGFSQRGHWETISRSSNERYSQLPVRIGGKIR